MRGVVGLVSGEMGGAWLRGVCVRFGPGRVALGAAVSPEKTFFSLFVVVVGGGGGGGGGLHVMADIGGSRPPTENPQDIRQFLGRLHLRTP